MVLAESLFVFIISHTGNPGWLTSFSLLNDTNSSVVFDKDVELLRIQTAWTFNEPCCALSSVVNLCIWVQNKYCVFCLRIFFRSTPFFRHFSLASYKMLLLLSMCSDIFWNQPLGSLKPGTKEHKTVLCKPRQMARIVEEKTTSVKHFCQNKHESLSK